MTVYDAIRRQVSIVDAAQRYGLAVDHHGMALCPFHSEKTPSLKLYPGDNSFFCFGCHRAGDVSDLTAQLIGTTSMADTARTLNADFALGLDARGTPGPAVDLQSDLDREKVTWFDAWCEKACYTLIRYLKLLRQWKIEYAPETPDGVQHPLFVHACYAEGYVEYLVHRIFIHGNYADKVEFWQTHREEVSVIERELEQHRENCSA